MLVLTKSISQRALWYFCGWKKGVSDSAVPEMFKSSLFKNWSPSQQEMTGDYKWRVLNGLLCQSVFNLFFFLTKLPWSHHEVKKLYWFYLLLLIHFPFLFFPFTPIPNNDLATSFRHFAGKFFFRISVQVYIFIWKFWIFLWREQKLNKQGKWVYKNSLLILTNLDQDYVCPLARSLVDPSVPNAFWSASIGSHFFITGDQTMISILCQFIAIPLHPLHCRFYENKQRSSREIVVRL